MVNILLLLLVLAPQGSNLYYSHNSVRSACTVSAIGVYHVEHTHSVYSSKTSRTKSATRAIYMLKGCCLELEAARCAGRRSYFSNTQRDLAIQCQLFESCYHANTKGESLSNRF
jgi:hypothetical protein